jgi:hypothetical protein
MPWRPAGRSGSALNHEEDQHPDADIDPADKRRGRQRQQWPGEPVAPFGDQPVERVLDLRLAPLTTLGTIPPSRLAPRRQPSTGPPDWAHTLSRALSQALPISTDDIIELGPTEGAAAHRR